MTCKKNRNEWVARFSLVAFLLTAQLAAQARQSATQGEVRRLESGNPVERELRGGEIHTYEIELQAGQCLTAQVEQLGVDVVIVVYAPGDKPLYEFNNEKRSQGVEPIAVVAEATGVYKLKVDPFDAKAPAGRYTITGIEIHAASEKDLALHNAWKFRIEWAQLRQAGKFDASIEAGERVLKQVEKVLGADHIEAARVLNLLALAYFNKGDYASAESDFKRAVAISERAFGQNHLEVAQYVTNLAELYSRKGDYANAESGYREALAIREKQLDANHPWIAASLYSLAQIYFIKGDYASAESFNQRGLTIRERSLPANHPEIGLSLNLLAHICFERGDYAKAEAMYKRALSVYEKAYSPEHAYVAIMLNSLAELYRVRGDYPKAEALYQRALAIYAKTVGPNHTNMANARNNLASLYDAMGDLAKAGPLYEEARAIYEKSFGPEHPEIATSLNNLGMLAYKRGDYASAEQYLQRALAMREKMLGAEHPQVTAALGNLATLYEATGERKKAIDYRARAAEISERNIARNIATGSEKQKLLYLSTLKGETDNIISMNVKSAPAETDATRLAMTTLLRRKGRALDALTDSVASLRRRLNPDDRQVLDQLTARRAQLAALVLRGPGANKSEQHRAEIKRLEEQVEKLEAEVSKRSAEFREAARPVTIDAVQDAMPRHAALVEFATYRPFNLHYTKRADKYGEPRYIAYVLHKRGDPRLVELGEAKAIDRKIAALRLALRDKRQNGVKRFARAVDRQVMQPVRRALGGTRRVLVSPDGALNLVPFAALTDERQEYLVNRFTFIYLTSGRDLLRLSEKRQTRQRALIMADPDFGVAKSENGKDLRDAEDGEQGDMHFEQLKQAGREGEELKAVMPEAEMLTKEKATETALKAAHSPEFLHIATHGFFLDDDSILESQAKSEGTRVIKRLRKHSTPPAGDEAGAVFNPLLRSGLGLAGANVQADSEGDDGILTALEAASLDLFGTKLVVLSACDTGVGEIRNGEGVYGLRRALVLAGSETQLMSLWPVSDSATREMMIAYYKRLKRGEGRGDALRQVQLRMLNDAKHQHPFYWASFIQSGEWANLAGERQFR